MKAPMWKKIAGLVVVAAAVAWLVYFLVCSKTGYRLTHIDVQQLSRYLRSLGPFSIIFGMLAVFLQTIFPVIPFIIVAGANVLAFGPLMGFVINYTVSCIAATVAFYFTRTLGHSWVEQRFGEKTFIREFNKKLERRGYLYIIIGRLIPVIPSTAINLGAGLSRIRFSHFLIGTVIGKLPIVYLESAIAHDLLHIDEHKGRLLLYLCILLALLTAGRSLEKRLFGGDNS